MPNSELESVVEEEQGAKVLEAVEKVASGYYLTEEMAEKVADRLLTPAKAGLFS